MGNNKFIREMLIIGGNSASGSYGRIVSCPLYLFDNPTSQKWGADDHPSAAAYRKMADQLIDFISDNLG